MLQTKICDLPDGNLAEIFRRLPSCDRLLISEVSKRWYGISRIAWTDIENLDLSPIPGPYITAVIKQCPNLRDVTASRKTFVANELHILARLNLHSLRLYRCDIVNVSAAYADDPLAAVFSSNLRNARWDELVVDELKLEFQTRPIFTDFPEFPLSFPTSLKRLQFSGVTLSNFVQRGRLSDSHTICVRGIEHLSELECFATQGHAAWSVFYAMTNFPAPQNLRELVIILPRFEYVSLLLSLSKLEVLFLEKLLPGGGPDVEPNADFVELLTKHPTLRILALTGYVDNRIDFPARVRYGNGFNSAPLPQLHVFVGKYAAERVRFPKFASDAAKVYPISEPLPQFLERKDIKPIFEGVWIAQIIKEAAKRDAGFYKHCCDVATTFSSIDS